METSLLIARLMGPVILVAAIPMIASPAALRTMIQEFLESRALVFLSGILALVGGVAIVNAHGHWRADWTALITFFGWAMVAGGVVRMVAPEMTVRMGQAMLVRRGLFRIAGVLWLLVGALLTYAGYGAGGS